jgi:hypothetical protein
MGIIRSIGKIFFSTLFTFFLISTISLYFLLNFLKYENLKEIFFPLIKNQINITEEQKDLILQYLKFECQNKEQISFNFGKNISLNCSEILNLKKEDFEDFVANKVLNYFYFQNISCNFFECIEKRNLEYFITFNFYNSLKKYFYISLIFTIISGIIYLLLIETIEGKLISFSTIFLLLGTTHFLIDYLFNNFLNFLNVKIDLNQIFIKIKQQLYFLNYFLIFGILLLIIYIFLVYKKLKRKNK